MTPKNLYQDLKTFLEKRGVPFEVVLHEEAKTCEAAAEARGLPQSYGGKTLLLKDKDDFRLFSLRASLDFDSKKARKILQSQKLRFATKEELWDLTGAKSGALPPFGRPLLSLDYYVDSSLLDNDKIAFNAGLLTCSFIMNTEDWLKCIENNFTRATFAKE